MGNKWPVFVVAALMGVAIPIVIVVGIRAFIGEVEPAPAAAAPVEGSPKVAKEKPVKRSPVTTEAKQPAPKVEAAQEKARLAAPAEKEKSLEERMQQMIKTRLDQTMHDPGYKIVKWGTPTKSEYEDLVGKPGDEWKEIRVVVRAKNAYNAPRIVVMKAILVLHRSGLLQLIEVEQTKDDAK